MAYDMFGSDAVEEKYRDHRAEQVRRKINAVEAEMRKLTELHKELKFELNKWL